MRPLYCACIKPAAPGDRSILLPVKDTSDRIIADRVLQLVASAQRRLLEVGCGDGRISALLAAPSRSLVAIDPNLEGLRRARVQGVDAGFVAASGERLPFPDRSFCRVLFTLSLHHQASLRALQEAGRVLSEGGEILVVEPMEGSEMEQVFRLLHDEVDVLRAARAAIRESGFRVSLSERLTATWRFEDRQELNRYLFDYYGVPHSQTLAREIAVQLGAKAGDRPLLLEDDVILDVLRVV